MSKVKVAATQMSCTDNERDNIDKAINLIKKSAEQGAQIILIQELFESVYFCCTSDS